MLGIRGPMRESEVPVIRPYMLVDDIKAAVKAAEADGATVAMPPMAIPEQLEAVIQKMLARNPSKRFQNAEDLSIALKKVEAVTDQQQVRPRDADPKATGWGGALDGLI